MFPFLWRNVKNAQSNLHTRQRVIVAPVIIDWISRQSRSVVPSARVCKKRSIDSFSSSFSHQQNSPRRITRARATQLTLALVCRSDFCFSLAIVRLLIHTHHDRNRKRDCTIFSALWQWFLIHFAHAAATQECTDSLLSTVLYVSEPQRWTLFFLRR